MIDEDAADQVIPLTGITSGFGDMGSIRVTAKTDDTAIMSEPTIVYSSAELGGSLKFKPLPDQNGTGTITVTVENGGLDGALDTLADNSSFSRLLKVTVNPVNDSPMISDISDLVTKQSTPTGDIAFTVSDTETPAQNLMVTATSSNQTLVPTSSIKLVGDDANRTVRVVPTEGLSGKSTITVAVTDGIATVIETFVITVDKADPIVTWSNPADITFGTLLSTTQLNATSTTPGVFVYSPAIGAKLNAGSVQELSVTFTPTDTANNNPVTMKVKINVAKANPVVSWTNPNDITFGTILSPTQLNATSTVPGTFIYTPADGEKLNSGPNQDLSVTFTPTDAANNGTITMKVKINVAKADPVVTWANPVDILIGKPLSATELNATADVPGAFVYSPFNGTVLPLGMKQTLGVVFAPTEKANFNNVIKSVNINVVAPTLDYGDAPSPYPVLLAQNGARHIVGSLFLGMSVDAKSDGSHSANSDSDSSDDGVLLNTSLIASGVATTSSITVIASGPGKLDGWIDFNNDGDWLDAGEQVFASTSVLAGNNLLSFTIPANSTVGSTGSRFRLSTAGALAPTGAATDGEVEDYLSSIVFGSARAALNITVLGGDTKVVVEGDSLVVRKGTTVVSKVPFANFGSLNLGGTSLDDILSLTILEALATKTLEFDGGLGKDFFKPCRSGQDAGLDRR